MAKTTRRTRRRKSSKAMALSRLGSALDILLAGQETVVGPDFLMMQSDPFHAEIGHLDPQDLRTFDQTFVDTLVALQPQQPVTIPPYLNAIGQIYGEQREQLSAYHHQATEELLLNDDLAAAKELGNFDPYLNRIVIRNEAELNVFYDYIALYRICDGKRAIMQWRLANPQAVNAQNQAVVAALEQARFALLRLDENLDHGAIRATNLITQTECLLIDRALNASRKEGCFFMCSLLDMGPYVMTSGGGTPLDPTSAAGKSAVTLLKKHLEKVRSAQQAFTQDIRHCVRELYGFCLRGGALKYMTVQ